MIDDEWVRNIATPSARFMAMDAMGVIIDGVTRARETDDGIEVYMIAATHEGDELMGSRDDGKTLEPLEAHLIVPGGMIVEMQADEVD